MDKKEIRRQTRAARQEQPEELRKERSLRICQWIMTSPAYEKAQVVLAYIETQGEVSLDELISDAWKNGKTVAVPRVEGKNMAFYRIESMDDLEEGSFHILEPKMECPEVIPEEDYLFLVPGVAYDTMGHRIGYGGGFYDRFLEKYPYLHTMGIGFDFQLYPKVPCEELDIPMECVVTESGFHPDPETSRQRVFMTKCRKRVQELSDKLGRPLTACVNTFGCQMNARDSEKLLGILKEIGYVESESEDADFVLYNTCTVRENANLRVYGRLGQLNGYKKRHPGMIIALCGCMMQEPTVVEKIKTSFRFVDIIFGTHNIFKLAELLWTRLEKGKMVVDVWEDTQKIVEELPVERKYPFKSGVNIMFGCNNFCTYCIVPYVRGRERSRNPEDIVHEIRGLVADGVKEVMLLGQNVNSYGKNLKEPMSFAKLLQEIEKIEGLERIRFMTSHPKDLSDELIQVMKESNKICRHLHLPLQSGSSRLLKIMNRHYTKESYLALAEKLRREIPDLALTTDIIVGFPGETEEDFEETLDVVRKVRYDSAFTFIYSPRTGTPAAAMPDQVPEDVVKPRFDRLLKEVQAIAAEVCSRDLGTVQTALVESMDDHDPALVSGRLSNNIMVHFPGDTSMIGTIVPVRLKESHGFYYIGESVQEDE